MAPTFSRPPTAAAQRSEGFVAASAADVKTRMLITKMDLRMMVSFLNVEFLVHAPHPPFGHLLPASGEKGNKISYSPCCPSPRVSGERVAEGRVRGVHESEVAARDVRQGAVVKKRGDGGAEEQSAPRQAAAAKGGRAA